MQQAAAYWVSRMPKTIKDPFVLHSFATAAEARAALLELPCIQMARSTHNLICTEVLVFGHYPIEGD